MDEREETRCDNRENRHRFCGTVNRVTPFSTEQKENRRDQCSGVTDTNPKYEVSNQNTPVNRAGFTSDTNTDGHFHAPGESTNQKTHY